MDSLKSQFQYYALVNGESQLKTVDVSSEDYAVAQRKGMSFSQFINDKCSDADKAYGSAFEQAVQEIGAASKVHGGDGTMSPTIHQIYQGMEAGPAVAGASSVITSPDGSNNTPAGRIFYPEILMDMMRQTLNVDNSDIEQGFDSMIGLRENISGGVYIQPLIDVTANESVASQPIAQGADPATMINITTSQVTRAIPTNSIGLQITDQAMQHATIDLVAIAIAAQSKGERARIVDNDIGAIINGCTDSNMSALTPTKLQDYDSAITSAGQVTHKGFLKMLHSKYQTRNLDCAIMSIDTYLKYQDRDGRPTVDKDRGTDERLNMNFKPVNFSLTDLNILIVDEGIIGANRALFLDKRYALRKVVDVTAQYEAIQNFVMRRINQMRFDYGFHTTRLYDEAFELVDLTV